MRRRSFLQHLSLLSTGVLAGMWQPAWSRDLHRSLKGAEGRSAAGLAGDEDFWSSVQHSFVRSSGLINLNNGGVSPAPKAVADALKKNFDYCNEAPSYFLWRKLDKGREPLRAALAAAGGCAATSVAINRNASEGLDTVLLGLNLRAGDEVLACRQDYNHAIFTLEQRARRDGIVLRWVDLELPSEDEAYLVRKYVEAFTPKTKLLLLTHVINWNGQVLPVAAIAAEARKRGIEVLVDGAHSFNQFPFSIDALNADYFVTSLHKWTYAPVGVGLLWVRPDKIAGLYPLHGHPDPGSSDIRKFESLGTRPFYIEQASTEALAFNAQIGIARKAERLNYLRNYWMDRVRPLPGVRLLSPTSPGFGLMNGYHIHSTVTDWAGLRGLRITPNVYSTLNDLDTLVAGINAFIKMG
ncbi:MAG: aminotransferase class V-fold PLP-dependent enzyme [Chitinophagaceae bacterium]|nr:MAG: aminotransferase class V-fold PLP-dependent enzyme [Chitinophagaceae bacterium]